MRGDDDRVLGPRHPRVAELRRLIRRRGPDAPVVLEGPRSVAEALDLGWVPRTLVVPADAVGDAPVARVLERLDPACEVLRVRPAAFERLAPSVSPQPLLALAPRPRPDPPSRLDDDAIVLVLVGISDPGNVGTLVRVADAVAAAAVVVVGGADPFGPKAVRASAGSVLRVPVTAVSDASTALDALEAAGATLVATDAHGGEAHDSGALSPPVAIVLGSESHGLDPAVVNACHRRVHIGFPGRAESLNVAMAGTLCAFEAHRRRPSPRRGTG